MNLPRLKTLQPVSTLTLVRLRRDDRDLSLHWPVVLDRITSMWHRYGGKADTLSNTLWQAYATKDPSWAVWAALDHAGRVVGHALAQVRDYDGTTVAWVAQVEMDTVAAKATKLEFLDEIERWVKEVNAILEARKLAPITTIMMSSPRMTDGWARHAGFDPYRMVYTRALKGV